MIGVMIIRYSYAILMVLTGIRFNDLKPLYNPFYGEITEGIAKDPRDPRNCSILYDNNGEMRNFWFPELLVAPITWFVVLIMLIETKKPILLAGNVVNYLFFYFLIKILIYVFINLIPGFPKEKTRQSKEKG